VVEVEEMVLGVWEVAAEEVQAGEEWVVAVEEVVVEVWEVAAEKVGEVWVEEEEVGLMGHQEQVAQLGEVKIVEVVEIRARVMQEVAEEEVKAEEV
jgi:hypothetical protein